MKILNLAILPLIFVMSSCITYKPDDQNKAPELTIFPIKPSLKDYSRQPIVEKKDNNFIVSDEFVENSILYKKYSDKIDGWKKQNNIK